MVLSSKDYHKQLISSIKEDLLKLEDDISTDLININIRVKSIKPYRNVLYKYYDLSIEDLYTVSSKSLSINNNKVHNNVIDLPDKNSIDVLQAAIFGLIIVKRRLENNYKYINELNKYLISYSIYKDITNSFNKYVSKELLSGHNVNLGFGLGKLAIRIIEGKKGLDVKSINWSASNKKKKEILSKGGIPFNKKDAIEHEKLGKVYNGEPWCIKADINNYPYIFWLGRGSHAYKHYYKFEPTRDNNTGKDLEELLDSVNSISDIDNLNIGIVKKLSLYLSFNPKLISNYIRNHVL